MVSKRKLIPKMTAMANKTPRRDVSAYAGTVLGSTIGKLICFICLVFVFWQVFRVVAILYSSFTSMITRRPCRGLRHHTRVSDPACLWHDAFPHDHMEHGLVLSGGHNGHDGVDEDRNNDDRQRSVAGRLRLKSEAFAGALHQELVDIRRRIGSVGPDPLMRDIEAAAPNGYGMEPTREKGAGLTGVFQTGLKYVRRRSSVEGRGPAEMV
ncbi:hypothetical protein QBC47DRAFT_379153 [Echria macrotheca]|uniref:Uncharacterized protein n=1 Tax=Echria macrotheca TaxID=438768 RepID=A0AAJ0FCF4_9PEZI|nr:hypothetical protein QBC47DRAFT_379153 [Echria macrotheca]